MLIDEMQHEFDQQVDRVSSQDRPDFYPNEKDVYINRSIKIWTKARYGTQNKSKSGFETNQERISNLMSLHIKYPIQPALIPIDLGGGLYEIQLSVLSYPYLFLTSAKIVIEKDNCTKTIDNTSWQIDDNKNMFNEPNFEWGRVHANFGRSSSTVIDGSNNNELYSIYFDTNNRSRVQQFTIKSVELNYIKTPNRVCLGTYHHIDDKINPPNVNTSIQHCDIPSEFHNEIVSIAVKLAFKDIQDQFGYQASERLTEQDE